MSFIHTRFWRVSYLIFRAIPSERVRHAIKNIIYFVTQRTPTKSEKLSYDGMTFYAHTGLIVSNTELLADVRGYNLHYKLKEGDIVVDAGAYNGLFTLYAAKKVGDAGRVYAFEPDIHNIAILQKNIALNRLKNVIVLNKGLYDRITQLQFDTQGASSHIVDTNSGSSPNTIDVTSLDEFVEEFGVERIDFVKMDIEGAELKAIRGAKKTMAKNKGIHFAIASYHVVKGEKTCHELERLFHNAHMDAITDNSSHLTTYASFQSMKKRR